MSFDKENHMAWKTIIFSMMLALLLSVAGCTSLTGETAGQYVDDSTITASVKAKLIAEKVANLTRVDVIQPTEWFRSTASSSLLIKRSVPRNWLSKSVV